MRSSRHVLFAPLLVTGLLACPAARAQDIPACPPGPMVPLTLPVLKAAVMQGEPVIIAAFGSSSTRGAAASDAAHTYPAVLQAELTRLLPGVHVAVINRGIGGQDAADELVRIGRDVIALRPRLVIWQVGANAALRDVDPPSFRVTIAAGVKRLKEAGTDVILMDNQRAQRIMDAPRRMEIEQFVAETARATGTYLFSRGALMDTWRAAGHGYERFLAADMLHHNDFGYRCVAEALASAIIAALRRE